MVPGFAGFDALGQLQYYAGLTPLFRTWKRADDRRGNAVLHYFDSFPTAAVVTRAARLRSYLAKRIARGEIQSGDRVSLVGHSTGGLDIRRLLRDLAECPHNAIAVDGGEGTACTVAWGDILGFVHRVVFLSVPQRGTNLADWVRAHALGRVAVIAELRTAAAASQLPLVDPLRNWLARSAAVAVDGHILHAIEDALTEIDAGAGAGGPVRTAAAHEAASELELWLRHMTWDFSAIDDLASAGPPAGPESPAHSSPPQGEEETRRWTKTADHEIVTRSYATLGRCPFRFCGPEVPTWELLRPGTYPPCDAISNADLLYRACYQACAGGPFEGTVPGDAPRYLTAAHQQTIGCWGHHDGIERWHNDGIVNTASMFWPDDRGVFLLPGDHMDVVGHYKLVDAFPGSGRKYQAYDLLGSASGFDDAIFEQVWRDVFTFCWS
jgi:hypothetical protein